MVVTLHRSRQVYLPIALFMGLYGACGAFVSQRLHRKKIWKLIIDNVSQRVNNFASAEAS